jgi:hypothetical protein
LVLLKSVILTLSLIGVCISPAMGTEIDQFEWIGKNADKIGTWDNGNPDGSMDGHFLLGLNLPAAIEIKSILIYSSDASGNPAGGQFWDTAATNYYILGLFDQGMQLNHNHVTSLGTFSGYEQFDLYAADSGWFENGNWFGVEVTLGDSTKLRELVSIGGSSKTTSGQSDDSTIDSQSSKMDGPLDDNSKFSGEDSSYTFGSKDQSPNQIESNTAIFDSWNTGSVDNNPTCSPIFTIYEPQMITYIDTYHWNYGQGTSSSGTISLQNENGETFGPWAVEAESASNVANAWWTAHPNVVIPKGTYIIIDSEPETWSQNSESPCGFAKVEGQHVPEDDINVSKGGQSKNKGTVTAYVEVNGDCSDNPISSLTEGCDKGLPGIPVELTFTYIPPAYSEITSETIREITDEYGRVEFKDVPAGSKFKVKTKIKTLEKELEGTMPDPAEVGLSLIFDYICKQKTSKGTYMGQEATFVGYDGLQDSPECRIYPL